MGCFLICKIKNKKSRQDCANIDATQWPYVIDDGDLSENASNSVHYSQNYSYVIIAHNHADKRGQKLSIHIGTQ